LNIKTKLARLTRYFRVLAPLMVIPTKRLTDKSLKYLEPLARQRLHDRARKASDPGFLWDEPLDYMKLLLDEPASFNYMMEKSPVTLARGTMMINAAAFFASAFALANVLLDIYSISGSMEIVEKLREECQRINAKDGLGTKAGVAKLVRIDSVIRESMRLRMLDTTAMHRYVKPKDGYTFDSGEFLPFGTHLCFPAGPYQEDGYLSENPLVFDPFRFSRDIEDKDLSGDTTENEAIRKEPMTAVSTGSTHFPWGVGKSQCPGRFFAMHEMKVALAEIVLNYDIEPLLERPENVVTGVFSMPPENVTLRVKRVMN
jgi:cytochrome P450